VSLTQKEKNLLNAIKKHITVKEAAISLGISPRTAYNVLFRIRRKYRKARDLVNTIIGYRRSDGYLDRLLALRQPLWREIKRLEKLEEEEEI